MKSLTLLLSLILLNVLAFSQNGVYLFGYMNNAPGTTFDISVIVYTSPPVTAQFTVNPDGQITNNSNYWVDLPSPDWTHFEVIYPTCNNETNILSVQADSLPNMIDVQYVIDYCPGTNDIYGCTDPNAINYNPEATIDDGSCILDNGGCVEINLDIYCVDTTSNAYGTTIFEDPFCCSNAWDQICQDAYVTNGGQPLPECAGADSCAATEAILIVNIGTWGQEISWTLSHEGAPVMSGNGYEDINDMDYFYDLCLEDGCYTFEMYDSYGDGWNGGGFQIVVDNQLIASGGLTSGQYGAVAFGINETNCDQPEILGCTDPAAVNYDPNATLDDGSCLFGCAFNLVELSIYPQNSGDEISWSLIQNDEVIDGGGNYGSDYVYSEWLCIEDGCFTLSMIDSDGDNPEGAWFTIGDFDNNILASGSLSENGFESVDFGVNSDCDSSEVIFGCTDPNAINYDPNATQDNGSCEYNSNVENDLCADATELQLGNQLINNVGAVNNENIWGECWAFGSGEGEQTSIWFSFTTPDEPATIHIEASPDGTNSLTDTQFGLFEECGGEMIYCDGNAGQGLFSAFHFECGELEENMTYILMIDGYFGDNGTCNLTYDVSTFCDVLGCTDPEAINYNPEATINDGSCEYETECTPVTLVLDGPSDGQGFFDLYSSNGTALNGVYSGSDQTYEWCLEDGCYDMFFVMGNGGMLGDEVYYTIFQEDSIIAGGTFMNQTSMIQFGINSECDSIDVYGCTDPAAINYNPEASIDDGTCEYEPCDANEVLVIIETATWGYEISWNIVQDGAEVAGDSGYDSNTAYTHVECLEDGCYTFEMFDSFGDGWNGGGFTILVDGTPVASGTLESGNYGSVDFGINTDGCASEIYGCTDPEAINYNPDATVNDGSCEYETECTSITLVLDGPSDNPGFWDLNLNNGTYISGEYSGSDQSYEWCLEDGCYELFFVMINGGQFGDEISYTIFQGDSIIAGGSFTDQTSILNFGVNTNCNSTDIYGCTDPEALNYNPEATIDDGSCEYNEVGCVEVGADYCVDIDSQAYYITVTQDSFCCDTQWDQICQDAYIDYGGIVGEDCDIYGCTDPEALNFNPEATMEDGSCEYNCTDVQLGFDFFNMAPIDSSQMTWTIVNNNGEIVEDGFFYNWAPQYDLCLEDGCYTLTVFDVATEWDGVYFIFSSNQTLAQGTFNGDENTFVTTFGVNAADCEDEDIYGCTDPNAINYNPNASLDDGSCEYEFDCGISFTVSPDTTGAQVIWITPSDNIYNAVSVEWDFGDGNTSNALFPIHTYDGDGPYMLCLTATFQDNGGFCEITYCAELTDEMINPPGMQSQGFSINVVDPLGTTGVVDTEWIGELTLWPNPATDAIRLEFVLAESKNLSIEVFDAIGQLVRQSNVVTHTGKNLITLDVKDLTPGIYIINLTGNNSQLSTRMIKQ